MKNFHFKKTIFQNRILWKMSNANPKMVHHRHKKGPREVSSTPTRYGLAGRDLGTHRKSFIPSSVSLFSVCGLLLYLIVNGRKWAQMDTKYIKLIILLYLKSRKYTIDIYLQILVIVTCKNIYQSLAHTFDVHLHAYLMVTYMHTCIC